jgi:hypothetical protein
MNASAITISNVPEATIRDQIHVGLKSGLYDSKQQGSTSSADEAITANRLALVLPNPVRTPKQQSAMLTGNRLKETIRRYRVASTATGGSLVKARLKGCANS